MKSQIEKVNEGAHKLASAMYAKTQAEGGAEGEGEPQDASQPEGGSTPSDDDVVDAEFEDISKK